jgi:predicted dehydrogenase
MTAAPLLTLGVVGCGAISDVYFAAISRSPALTLKSVAARGMDSAVRQASRYGGDAVTFDAMLADPAIDLIVNLTPSSQHLELNRRILEAGKHLYTEKPFVLSLADAQALAALAEARGLRIGSAPDTFFGAAHQAARALVDEGAIGRPVHGAGFVGHPGIEHFHPNPSGFYQPGSEPPYEIGPYYITQLVNLLGPVESVLAHSARGPAQRTTRRGPRQGESFPVDVPTSYAAILVFEQGAMITLTLSLDVARHARRPIELYGTEGSLQLCDPNFFGGTLELSRAGGAWEQIDTADRALGTPNRDGLGGGRVADYRGIGVVEMAEAMASGRPHRTGLDLVSHCVEVMEAIMRAAAGEMHVAITTRCARPSPFARGRDDAVLALMRSPHEAIDGPI